MARPTALLIAGGADYHNTPDHYECLAGLLAGPAGLNLTITDEFPSQTTEGLRRYDLLVLWATFGKPPPEPVQALFEAVRQGTPLLGLHAAPYTVREVEGGPEAIGSSYIKRFPHLPYQEVNIRIIDTSHPVTSGVEDFRITDELYCLDEIGADARILAGYDGREANAPYRQLEDRPPDPRHELAHEWRMHQPRAPLMYVKQLGAGKICVNAMGHDGAALRNPGFRQLTVQAINWLLI